MQNLAKRKSGISMITLVISIVVLLVIIGIAFGQSLFSVGNATKSAFMQELTDVEQNVSSKRTENQIYGVSEDLENKGFHKAQIINPPASFKSFDKNDITGYVVDLELIKFTDAVRGQNYIEYKDGTKTAVTFGEDDVYVYDADGKSYYAKGLIFDDNLYYSLEELNADGPIIISKTIVLAADNLSAEIIVVVRPEGDGQVTLTLEGEAANDISAEGAKERTFSKTVYENKTYRIVATEEDKGSTTQSIKVTEIEAPTYEIIYDANGGTSAPPQAIKTQNVILKLSLQYPKREGYTFVGWSTSEIATLAEYRPGSEFTKNEDTRLYAVWKEGTETYNVIYNANGGKGAPPSEYNLIGTYVISNQVPRREGFGFEGWNTDVTATEGIYKPGDSIELTEDLELYAIWKKGEYTVSIKTVVGGVEVESAEIILVGAGSKKAGEDVVVSAKGKEESGYIFSHWTIVSGGVKLSNTESPTTTFVMPANNVELRANFEEKNVTIKYDANGGTGAPASRTAKVNSTIQLSIKEPQRNSYKFIGWSLRRTDLTPMYTSGDNFEVKESVVLYAVWEKLIDKYVITFDLNGGAGPVADTFKPIYKNAGEKIQLPEEVPTKEGYAFVGWTLEKTSEEVIYKSGDWFEKDVSTILYAVYVDAKEPTIEITSRYENDDLILTAEAYDEGLITGYSWTKTDSVPTTWETEGTGKKEIIKEIKNLTSGETYFWVKDTAGNVASANVRIYEIKYEANGGVGGPTTQLKAHDLPLIITKKEPTSDKHVFLGWSIAQIPGNTEYSVNYKSGDSYNNNDNATLTAVWGEVDFQLSKEIVYTQVGKHWGYRWVGLSYKLTLIDNYKNVMLSKSQYTGNITVESSDEKIAKATYYTNKYGSWIKIDPGEIAGEVTVTVRESTIGLEKKITVIVEKGERFLRATWGETNAVFTYGVSWIETVGLHFEGTNANLSLVSTNQDVATARIGNGNPWVYGEENRIWINPKNVGTAKIKFHIDEDEGYKAAEIDINITIIPKTITVYPEENSKVYDGTTSTPELTYTLTGGTTYTSMVSGKLSRVPGKDIGAYLITLGSLTLEDKGNFKASNYKLVLDSKPVYFKITPEQVTKPVISSRKLEFNGKEQILLEDGEKYKVSGIYKATNVGKYSAIVELKDPQNTYWKDTLASNAYTISWEITSLSLGTLISENEKITISSIPDQVYTGLPITPDFTVTYDNSITLEKDKDYEVAYSNNKDAGKATIRVTGKGNYGGTCSTTFNITPATMQVDAYGYEGIYDGKSHSITVNVMKPATGATIYYSSTKELTESNYTSFTTIINPKVTDITETTIYYYITAKNYKGYAGNAKIKIEPKDITTGVSVNGIKDTKYKGSQITQALAIKDVSRGKLLTENTDYKVEYENNKDVSTEESKAIIRIKGFGNYKGTIEESFSVLGEEIIITQEKSSISNQTKVTITRDLSLSLTTLQYSYDNTNWEDYSSLRGLTITENEEKTLYARTIDKRNDNKVIGTAFAKINNVCNHSDKKAATCTEKGYCKSCGGEVVDSLGHEFKETPQRLAYLAKYATCTTNAEYYYKCTRCSEKSENTYEAENTKLGHDFTRIGGSIKQEATCTQQQERYYLCSRCDEESTSDSYKSSLLLPHDYTIESGIERTAATCLNAKTCYYSCSMCNTTSGGYTYYKEGDPLGHDFTSQTPRYIISFPTCTEEGRAYYACTRCTLSSAYDNENTYTLPKKEHEFTQKNPSSTYLATNATCVHETTYYYKCRNCTAYSETDTYSSGVKDPDNHIGGTQEHREEPTAYKDGRIYHTCNSCGAILDETVIPKLAIYAMVCSDNSFEMNMTGTPQSGKTLKEGTSVWTVESKYTSESERPWDIYSGDITSINITEDIEVSESTAYWFTGFVNATSVTGLEKIKTTQVTDMQRMFYECEKLTTIDLSTFEINNVTNTTEMFKNNKALQTLTLPKVALVSLIQMKGMFEGCELLEVLDLTIFNTEEVTDMSNVFTDCKALRELNVTSWNTSNVESFSRIFANCTSIEELDLSSWSGLKAENIGGMFQECTSLKRIFGKLGKLEFPNRKTSILDNQIFINCINLEGGQGTKYDENHVNYEYARIDQANTNNSKKGYFTDIDTHIYHEHTFTATEPKYLKNIATCTTAATYYYACEVCKISSQQYTGESYRDGETAPHVFAKKESTAAYIVSQANCIEKATYKYRCENCTAASPDAIYDAGSKNLSNHVDGTRHEYNPEPTYENAGYKLTVCNSCEGILERELIPSLVMAVAIYSETDNSLTFYKDSLSNIKIAEYYAGKIVTEIYTGFETETYNFGPSAEAKNTPWYHQRLNIKTVSFNGTIAPISTESWFAGCSSLIEINNLGNLDISNVENMRNMFNLCLELKELDLSEWNTANVTSMHGLFAYCGSLKKIIIGSNFDVSNVTNAGMMFSGCGISSIPSQMLSFSSKLIDAELMFQNSKNITKLDLSNFDATNVNSMQGMFRGCNVLQQVIIGEKFEFKGLNSWLPEPDSNYISGATGLWYDMETDIGYAPSEVPDKKAATYSAIARNQKMAIYSADDNSLSFEFGDVPAIDSKYNEKTVTAVYTNFENLGDSRPEWNTHDIHTVIFNTKITPITTNYWFAVQKNLKTIINMQNLDMSQVTYAINMFASCENLKSLDLSSWNTLNMVQATEMFEGCYRLEEVKIGPNFKFVTYLRAPSSTYITGADGKWYNQATGVGYEFNKTPDRIYATYVATPPKTVAIYTAGNKTLTFTKVTKVPTVNSIFKGNKVTAVYQDFENGNYTTVPWSGYSSVITNVNFEGTVKPASTANWFSGFEALTSITEMSTYLDTSNVTNMSAMFYGCKLLKAIDASKFNTAKVTTMQAMFSECRALLEIDLTTNGNIWNVSQVQTMQEMFSNCRNLTKIWMNNWNLSSLETAHTMFQKNHKLSNLYGFEAITTTGKLSNLYGMFWECKSLTAIHLNNWNMSSAKRFTKMFGYCENLETVKLSTVTDINSSEFNTVFIGCTKLKNVNLSGVKSVKYLYETFESCTSLETLDLGNMDNTSIKELSTKGTEDLFKDCTNLKKITIGKNFIFDNKGVSGANYYFPGTTWKVEGGVTTFASNQIPIRTGITTYVKVK